MKKWYESKIVWFNAITTNVLISQLFGEIYPNLVGVTVAIAGVGNIILRVWFTDLGIER